MKSARKHKTVGVSLSPKLREEAAQRARELGLSFSRYVAQCLENHLRGALEPAATRLQGFGTYTNHTSPGDGASTARQFEADVEQCLRELGHRYEREPQPQPRFLIEQEGDGYIALECRHQMRERYTVTLGEAIILRRRPDIAAVYLCVPYLASFDKAMLQTYEAEGIHLCTPDTLPQTLQIPARKRR